MVAEQRVYYRGQGKIFAHAREFDATSGVSSPGAGFWLGNAPEFTISLSVEKQDHRESYSGQNLIDISYITAKNASLTMTLEEFSSRNLALCLNGDSQDVPASLNATDITFDHALAAGEIYSLGGVDLTEVDFELADTSPVPTTSYNLDVATGVLEILATVATGATISFKTGAYSGTSMFTKPDLEWWVRFSGVNMLDQNKPTVVDLYRVKFEPAQNLSLISAELAQFPVTGTPLADTTRPTSDPFGQFGRIQVVRG
jgi:hypothetical protein